MLGIIHSELLKMRHTFSMKLVFLAPLVILLLGYLLSGSYVQLSAYNWWYSMILPIVVSLCSASMIVREEKNGMQNIICLPVRFDKIWLGKTEALVILLLAGLFSAALSTVLFGVPFSYMTGTQLPVRFFVLIPIVLWVSNIMMYGLHLILAFRFGRNFGISIGVIGSLLSALLQTSLVLDCDI